MVVRCSSWFGGVSTETLGRCSQCSELAVERREESQAPAIHAQRRGLETIS
jgi:hypothetical protein